MSKKEIIDGRGISSIQVTKVDVNKETEIKNEKSIDQIVKRLNESEREPLKFLATYRLKIKYLSGDDLLVLCSGASMNVGGITYHMNDKIQSILENAVK